MKYKQYTLLLIATIIFNMCANAQSFLWAKNARGADNEYSKSVATDNAGNAYITGYFHGANIIFGTTTLTNTGGYDTYMNPCTDIFIARYSSAGNVDWAKSYGVTDGMEQALSITVDSTGNSYVTGWFANAPFVLGSNTLTNHGTSWDVFLAKFDVNGDVVWAKGIGGSSDDVGYSVTVSDSGNVYLAGYYSSSSVNFGGGITLIGTGSNVGFLAKYDSSGNIIWAKNVGNDGIASVVVSHAENIYVTGKYTGMITLGTFTLTSSGGNDIFVAKYSPSGTPLWAKKGGGTGHDYATAVTIDPSENVYCTGFYRGHTMTFGTTILTNNSVKDTADIYIAKYDNAGNLQWAKSGNGDDWDQSTGIDADNSGNVYVTGYFLSDQITFGDTSVTNANVTYILSDIFIVKYDGAGNVLWLTRLGEPYEEYTSGINYSNSGSLFFTGTFNDPTFNIGPSTLTNAGQFDLFIAKMGTLMNVDELPDQSSIGVFPNPSEGEFYLNINTNTNKQINIRVYNLSGQLMMSESNELGVGNNLATIDLHTFSKGIYLLEVSSDNMLYHKKLIVQ
jgi:hypothetical protein